MRRFLIILSLVLVLRPGLSLSSAAQAPSVRDGAAVLTQQAQSDAAKASRLIADKTDISLLVDIRHFLGGAEAGAYARKLLLDLEDPDSSMLLLVVAGEDSYALAAGSRADRLLGKDVRDTLLSKHFRTPFLDRQYDQAVGAFMLNTALELSKATGEKIDLKGLFGYTGPQETQAPQENKGTNILNFVLGEPVSPAIDSSGAAERSQREERGLSIGSIVIIGLVLSSIFGKRGRKTGCGCGPLGWIFGVFGLSKLFGRRR